VLVGHALMALTVLATLGAIASSRSDDAVEANPVGGHTLEWTIASPAPADNFEALPTVSSAEPELDNLAGTEGSPS
jgi:heme/copper-type cytochrome/quinol oxidase subunit 1